MAGGKDILRKVLWFRERGRFDIDFFDALQPQRLVSEHPRYKSGVYYSEKCGREIQYESALELEFVKRLEKNEKVRFYWDQPVRIPYHAGKHRGTYTPDYGIYLNTREFVIAEIKDLPGMLDHRVQAKTEALMDFCSRRGFGLLLTDGRHTPAKLLEGKVNRRLERELLAAVEVGVLRKRQCYEIMERCGATQSELYRAIIRHELKFKPYPFKLQRGNQSPIYRQVYIGKMKYDDAIESQFPDIFKLLKR